MNVRQQEQSGFRQSRFDGWLEGAATANIEAAGGLSKN